MKRAMILLMLGACGGNPERKPVSDSEFARSVVELQTDVTMFLAAHRRGELQGMVLHADRLEKHLEAVRISEPREETWTLQEALLPYYEAIAEEMHSAIEEMEDGNRAGSEQAVESISALMEEVRIVTDRFQSRR
jgi:hypothetical protein